jgi:hypothetical protein
MKNGGLPSSMIATTTETENGARIGRRTAHHNKSGGNRLLPIRDAVYSLSTTFAHSLWFKTQVGRE